jgi:hypothetical protein
VIRDLYAYAFKSALSLAEILEKLNASGPWQWLERDNDKWGEYISTRPIAAPHDGVAKILSEGDHYAINIELRSEAPGPQGAFDAVRALVRETILPAIGAHEVVETDDYD